MLETIIAQVLTEYGLFVTLLIISIASLWIQNRTLTNKLLEVIENNTKVLAQIVEKLAKIEEDVHNDNNPFG